MVAHSVFIGANYQGSQNELAGCIPDAKNWQKKFKPCMESTNVVLERGATLSGIRSAILQCLGKLKPGDLALIQWSGHGTRVPDQDGDEEDRYDEAWVPYDMQDGLYLDDQVNEDLAKRVEDTQVILVTDCCHSGSIARAFAPTPVRSLPWSRLMESLEIGDRRRLLWRLRPNRRPPKRPPNTPAIKLAPGLVHLSGCTDTEFSYDIDVPGFGPTGAFSYYALKTYDSLPAGATVADWHKAIRKHLPDVNYTQAPCLNGDGSILVPGK